jgi:hypothetical protein
LPRTSSITSWPAFIVSAGRHPGSAFVWVSSQLRLVAAALARLVLAGIESGTPQPRTPGRYIRFAGSIIDTDQHPFPRVGRIPTAAICHAPENGPATPQYLSSRSARVERCPGGGFVTWLLLLALVRQGIELLGDFGQSFPVLRTRAVSAIRRYAAACYRRSATDRLLIGSAIGQGRGTRVRQRGTRHQCA